MRKLKRFSREPMTYSQSKSFKTYFSYALFMMTWAKRESKQYITGAVLKFARISWQKVDQKFSTTRVTCKTRLNFKKHFYTTPGTVSQNTSKFSNFLAPLNPWSLWWRDLLRIFLANFRQRLFADLLSWKLATGYSKNFLNFFNCSHAVYQNL